MKRSLIRDIIGTTMMFFVLVGFTIVLILGENYLEAFKSH